MTEDIQNYKFDFMHEANLLKSRMGDPINYIALMDVEAEPSDNLRFPPDVKIPNMFAGQNVTPEMIESFKRRVTQYYEDPAAGGSATQLHAAAVNGNNISVVALAKSPEDTIFGEKYAELMRLSELLHEVGHVRYDSQEPPTADIAADSYMALSFLARFGRNALPFLSQISWMRSYEALSGDTSHLTSFALDKIIVDYEAGTLTDFSESNIAALAKSYAGDWTPKQQALADMSKKFASIMHDAASMKKGGMHALLSQTFLSSPNAISRYTAAKVMLPLMQPGATYSGGTIEIPEAREFQRIMRGEQAKTGLSADFDSQAARQVDAPTMIRMLHYHRAPGKPLQYKP
jgi:hypothetical protein